MRDIFYEKIINLIPGDINIHWLEQKKAMDWNSYENFVIKFKTINTIKTQGVVRLHYPSKIVLDRIDNCKLILIEALSEVNNCK